MLTSPQHQTEKDALTMRLTPRFSVATLIALIATAGWPAIPTIPSSSPVAGEGIVSETGSTDLLAGLRGCAVPFTAAGSLAAQEPPPGNPTLAGCIAGCVYAGEIADEAGVDPAIVWEAVKGCKAVCVTNHGTQ